MPLQNNYNNYQVEDFICDDNFINWVKNAENDAFWNNWLKENPDKNQMIDHAKTLLNHLTTNIPVDNTKVKKALWEKIDSDSTPKIAPKKKTASIWLYRVAAVASVALLFFLLRPTTSQPTEVITQTSTIEQTILADQSLIASNENSTIRYVKEEYNKESRKIELDGEAFFKVVPGKPFEVKTTIGTVRVLGTSFNVLSRVNVFEVTCFTGKVKVSIPNGSEVILTAGEKTSFANQQLLKTQHNKGKQNPQWLNAYKDYQAVDLVKVAKDIEMFFGVKVIIDPAIENKKVSAKFRFGTLEETAKTITWPLKLKYEITSDTLRIK